jgi:hypothetical protein|nr:DUF4262 domain-containing protein [Neorhizobium tomejilense]
MADFNIGEVAELAKKLIAENGYFIQGTLGNEEKLHPAYYYTSGLSYAREKRYPELVMAGWLEPSQIAGFLSDAVEAMRAGRIVPKGAGYYPGVFANCDVGIVPIRPRGGDSVVLIPESADAFLVVIPDPAGLFPWEKGCSEDYADQVKGFDLVALPPPRNSGTLH